MTEQELNMAEQVADMEADIRVTIMIFLKALKTLGLNIEEMNNPNFDIRAKLPSILMSLTRKMSTGELEEEMSEFKALAPIVKKYEHLYKDLLHG
jgi:hypothetical protein